MKKNWGDNGKKISYSEMWGNTVCGGAYENSEGLFMCDGPIKTV